MKNKILILDRRMVYESTIYCPKCKAKHKVEAIIGGVYLDLLKEKLSEDSRSSGKCVIEVWKERAG